MSEGFVKQSKPFNVPTDDGKIIEEHFGLASVGGAGLSIAHMVSGKKLVRVDGQEIEVAAGESLLVKSGHRVQYSNPFSEAADYWSVCRPAFSAESVHRSDGAQNRITGDQ